MPSLSLMELPGRFAVCRLDPDAAPPTPASGASFWSVTRTRNELSLVVSEEAAPPGAASERRFRALSIEGTLDFSLTGILAAMAAPLAAAAIPIFVISTYDTDTVFVREKDFEHAVRVLREAGHQVRLAP
jgi:hypothetical protein